MSDCTRWQQQIDELPQLTANQVAALKHHVAGCEQCAAFKAERDQTARLLRGIEQALPLGAAPEIPLESMRARLARSRRQSRIAWLGMLVALGALAWFATTQQIELAGAVVLLGVAILCGLAGWWFGGLQRIAAAGLTSSNKGLLDAWATSTSRQLWLARLLGGIAAIDGAALLTAAVRSPELVLLAVIGAPLLAAGLFTLFREVPALKRELQMARGIR